MVSTFSSLYDCAFFLSFMTLGIIMKVGVVGVVGVVGFVVRESDVEEGGWIILWRSCIPGNNCPLQAVTLQCMALAVVAENEPIST